MKNENTKSTTTHVKRKLVLATCLILAAFGLAAAELSRAGGSPPVNGDVTFTITGVCSFDVQATVDGKDGTITLPNGGFILTSPGAFVTFTNLSDPTKSVTLNLTGAARFNGNTIIFTGRNGFSEPSTGLLFLTGNFTAVFDSNGNLIQGPTGNGQITQVCDLIN